MKRFSKNVQSDHLYFKNVVSLVGPDDKNFYVTQSESYGLVYWFFKGVLFDEVVVKYFSLHAEPMPHRLIFTFICTGKSPTCITRLYKSTLLLTITHANA